MEMIEIDPNLFVTCRLCLDNLGGYQIVPTVQQQIKFCYDIEVDPFDGLPQLICKNCKSTLSKYAEIKTTLVDKQKTLRQQLEGKTVKTLRTEAQNEQETVSSTQQLTSEHNNEKRCESICSASSDTDTSIKLKVKRKKKFKRIKKLPLNIWEMNYDTWYICRFCERRYKTRTGMRNHINTHPSLLSTYQTYIKNHCYVKLKKEDGKPNICNSKRIVVHSRDKFVISEDRFYYTLLTPKNLSDNIEDQNSTLHTLDLHNNLTNPESSDSEPFLGPKKKRWRLLSRSSNETVVLENNPNESSKSDFKPTCETTFSSKSKATEPNYSVCINIEDSSDSESNTSSNNIKSESNANTNLSITLRDTDNKTIQNIINMCYKKYIKRHASCENEIPTHLLHKPVDRTDSSLKHKVLSFGRKVINYPGINCIGLLRYLEHQNLEIIWIPRLMKKFEHVRIMTKLRTHDQNYGQDVGWEILYNADQVNEESTDMFTEEITPENRTIINKASDSNVSGKAELSYFVNNVAAVLTEQAVLSLDNTTMEKDLLLKKLLNANPVPNPKKLPKLNVIPSKFEVKKNSVNKKFGKKNKINSNNNSEKSNLEKKETVENYNGILPMPVITSTMSLAPIVPENIEQQNCDTNNVNLVLQNIPSSLMPEECAKTTNTKRENYNEIEISETLQGSAKTVPRIKVKPLSELMSEDEALNTIQNQGQKSEITTTTPCQKINVPFENMANGFMVMVPQSNNLNCQESQNQSAQNKILTTTSEDIAISKDNSNREYVLMDSVDLPCIQTDSPFRYFKNLLHIHNIMLLDASEKTMDFVCLLKFKLEFRQSSNLPVVLCLALFYSRRKFCLKVKDVNQRDIDISRLSANWQWEILNKCTRQDVDALLRQNAQKISQEVYDCTQIFLCLLKSIKFQKLT